MEMKTHIELVLDCVDPEGLAGFWREALHYRDFIVSDALTILVPRDETGGVPLLLQGVPEAKRGKNRMHLDIIVRDLEAEIVRLVELGARRIDGAPLTLLGTHWVRMADPDGNEFCVSTGVPWGDRHAPSTPAGGDAVG